MTEGMANCRKKSSAARLLLWNLDAALSSAPQRRELNDQRDTGLCGGCKQLDGRPGVLGIEGLLRVFANGANGVRNHVHFYQAGPPPMPVGGLAESTSIFSPPGGTSAPRKERSAGTTWWPRSDGRSTTAAPTIPDAPVARTLMG